MRSAPWVWVSNRVYHHLTTVPISKRVGNTLVLTLGLSGDALSEPLGDRLTLTKAKSSVEGATEFLS